ncbi:hypothetical protein B0O99DRAFT_522493 [Bisporella sp. PMI_857]|nr:hypothetical protein B0O99DRAFT_522493 [Bisporella sp. PMI_857]
MIDALESLLKKYSLSKDKDKPIKFKDAVGRKFTFPFDICATWAGMEELIRQAFMHVDVLGPHVADGHYDLIGPNGEIILPQVWETMIEPDWSISMHMWPMPEKPPPSPPKTGHRHASALHENTPPRTRPQHGHRHASALHENTPPRTRPQHGQESNNAEYPPPHLPPNTHYD